jgi:acyl-CoA thioesterase FadM
MVSRFSGAAAQLSAAIGVDRASMQHQRRGFSTFEQILQLSRVLRLDAPYRIETGIGHLSNSSLRMIHWMTDPHTGAEVGRLSQYGVNLDLDTRRPARWPEYVRDRAAPLVVPGG